MKSFNPKQSLALVGIVAVLGGYIGSSVTSAYVMNNNWAPQSRRYTQYDFNLHRDVGTMLRLQDRRMARLRANQEAERLFGSAPEYQAEFDEDIRSYYGARRWCIFNGYDHQRRLSTCIQSVTTSGDFEGRQ